MKKINFLNCDMHLLNIKQTVDYIDKKIEKNEFIQQVVINVAKLVNLQKDKKLYRSVIESDLVNIDGMGIIYGAKFLNLKVLKEHKVSGIDLFLRLLKLCEIKKYKIFLLGGTDEVIKKTKKNLVKKFPNLIIAGIRNGFFEDNEIEVVNKIKDSGAKLLFVGISSPKKENFINLWKNEFNVNYVMGVGGAFDVISGKTRRAPLWMQNIGLEWFFRFLQEPRKMFFRYFITNTVFFIKLLKIKLNLK